MEAIKLTSKNIMFTEPMGSFYSLNIGLIIGKQYNYLIDTGIGSGSVQCIQEYLKDDSKPVVVINTHHHWDHVWGNHVFKDSIIVSHRLCRELLDEYWDVMIKENTTSVDGYVEKCLPNLVFEEGISFPTDNIEVFFTPGHSTDCISIYDRDDKVLYAGDNIGDTKEVIVPYIDTDIEVMRRTIKKYEGYDFEICISGHNKPQTRNITTLMENALESCWERQLSGNYQW